VSKDGEAYAWHRFTPTAFGGLLSSCSLMLNTFISLHLVTQRLSPWVTAVSTTCTAWQEILYIKRGRLCLDFPLPPQPLSPRRKVWLARNLWACDENSFKTREISAKTLTHHRRDLVSKNHAFGDGGIDPPGERDHTPPYVSERRVYNKWQVYHAELAS
jgi:hypothetical protein